MLVDYVAFLSQKVAKVLDLFTETRAWAAPSDDWNCLFLAFIAYCNSIIEKPEVFPHSAETEVLHFDTKRSHMIFYTRTLMFLFVLLGTGQRASKEIASRATIFVLIFHAYLAFCFHNLGLR